MVGTSQENNDGTGFFLDSCGESSTGLQDYFGPLNLGSLFQNCQALKANQMLLDSAKILPRSPKQSRSLTNRVFLLGSYKIMMESSEVNPVIESYHNLRGCLTPYKGVSRGSSCFDLTVDDCWSGLERAKLLGWVSFEPGGFDFDEYANFDSVLNADLHEVVPGKIVAMRGPKDLHGGLPWADITVDGAFSHRDFSPAHYCEILEQFDVRAVIRLNEPHYDRQTFLRAGIAVVDLFFEDCTNPPVDVVAKFLAILEAVPGAVAVHCKSGLGRTGTLIGLYLMKCHGFSAREAMGWMRIVRPGSVIGCQQEFLCAREQTMRRHSAPLSPPGGALGRDGGVEAVQRAVDDICRFYDARHARALSGLGRAPSLDDLEMRRGSRVKAGAERRPSAASGI